MLLKSYLNDKTRKTRKKEKGFLIHLFIYSLIYELYLFFVGNYYKTPYTIFILAVNDANTPNVHAIVLHGINLNI